LLLDEALDQRVRQRAAGEAHPPRAPKRS